MSGVTRRRGPLSGRSTLACTFIPTVSWRRNGHHVPGTMHYAYDPANPVRTLGGNTLMPHLAAGPFVQAPTESREDVLTFTSAPLEDDVEVTGRVTARLTVATDGPTTDWVVRVCDVSPEGRSINVVDGITRATHTPGEPTTDRCRPLVDEHDVQGRSPDPRTGYVELLPALGSKPQRRRRFRRDRVAHRCPDGLPRRRRRHLRHAADRSRWRG